MSKVRSSGTACYAKGGAVYGKTSEFMKTDNEFTGADDGTTDEVFGKGTKGAPANPKVKTKSQR